MKTYIYAIKNLINNKLYIGSSKSPKSRKSEHFYHLKKGTHHSEHLQKSYNKYGKGKFAFYILEECLPDIRQARELHFITLHNSFDRNYGYNVNEPNNDSFKCSDDTKKKLAKTMTSIGRSIPIDVYDLELNKVNSFPSVKECATFYKILDTPIHDILSGKRKSYKGYTFTKKDEPCLYKMSRKQRDMSKFYK